MMWSKLKSRIEAGFADCVRGRVEVWSTRYRRAHDEAGEGWITIDKTRVHSMGTLSFYTAQYLRAAQGPAAESLTANERWKKAEDALAAEGILPLYGFNNALFEYLNLSIEDVLASDQMMIRAFGMFDKRLGKRRLLALDLREDHELVRSFHGIRCAWEGVNPVGSAQTAPFD